MAKRTTKKREIAQRVGKIERKIERRGGARVNAGRPPGTPQVVKRLIGIREITEDIIKSGKVPLRVMVNNMLYYDEQATYIQEELEQALAENMKKFDPDQFERCLNLMAKMGDARMSGQRCATDAAPYLHPRLSSMDIQVTRRPPKDLKDDVQTERFSDDFRQLRSQPYIIEQEVVDVEPEQEETE